MTRNGAPGRRPDFVVIGCTKGGTTSLDHYLRQHPQVDMAPKEPRFFLDAADRGNWERGETWYRGLFQTDRPVCGECSPSYTHWPTRTGVAERMSRLIPEARLVYLVREPWSRLRSHYLMNYRTGTTTLDFSTYLRQQPQVVDASCYGSQLAHYHEFFPRDQILVLESAELLKNTARAFERVCQFLGLDGGLPAEALARRYHVGSDQGFPAPLGQRLLASAPLTFLRRKLHPRVFYQIHAAVLRAAPGDPPPTELPPAEARLLASRFRDEVTRLRALTGQPLPSLDTDQPPIGSAAALDR